MNDCGCGGGKKNCITKKMVKLYKKKFPKINKTAEEIFKFVNKELKKLDCGCGCKGEKKFCEKYGLKGGGVLADCPKPSGPEDTGWRQDPLTCVKNCPHGYRDDGLTCVKNCPEGWISDPLTCRKPITSSMNECPPGSRDIAGTCWGNVRRDCIDDCFKHPAPGCRTWECGRLRGAFGEDWGPRWCTECNSRCGQTCWDVQGITKQLHQRNLRVQGGEVIGRQIIGKEIRGRVDLGAAFREFENLMNDLIIGGLNCLVTGEQTSCDAAKKRLQQIADALDPEKNGIAESFRKFGAMTQAAFEDIGRKIKEGFERFAAETRKWGDQLIADLARGWNENMGWLNDLVTNPDFWLDVAIGIMNAAAVVVAAAATAGTLGLAGPAAFALVALTSASGPALKMTADAARGRPVDALDIASIGLALIPGAGSSAGAAKGLAQTLRTSVKVVNTGRKLAQAGQAIVACVRVCQAAGLVPHTYIANIPPPPPDLPDIDPNLGQDMLCGNKTRNWYLAEAGKDACFRERRPWAQGCNTRLVMERLIKDCQDREARGEEQVEEEEQKEEEQEFVPCNPFLGECPEEEEEVTTPTTPALQDFVPCNPFIGECPEEGAGKRRRRRKKGGFLLTEMPLPPERAPLSQEELKRLFDKQEAFQVKEIGPNKFEDTYFGETQTLKDKDIPRTHTGAEFNPECYARKNPEIASALGNDPRRLTSHWIEIGSKEHLDADCGPGTSVEERIRKITEKERKAEINEARKKACASSDSFWDAQKNECDSHRHADGRVNTAAEECRKRNSYFGVLTSDNKTKCFPYVNPDGSNKTPTELARTNNNYWNPSGNPTPGRFYSGEINKNVDGKPKTKRELCESYDSFWTGTKCDVHKFRDGKTKTTKDLCEKSGADYNEKEKKCGFIARNGRTRGDVAAVGLVAQCNEDYSVCRRNNGYRYSFIPDNFKALQDIMDLEGKDLPNDVDRTDIQPPRAGASMPQKSLTLYWAKWCPHCHTLMPEWNKLKSKYKDIEIRKLEEKENDEYEVRAYPTIVYRDGSNKEPKVYKGDRSLSALKSFMDSKIVGGKKKRKSKQ